VDSGAFWFYRKLGFRPTDPEVGRLVAREETRMRRTPAYRSSRQTLQRLAKGYLLYEIPGTESGDWDRFRIRTLAQRLERAKPGSAERRAVAEIARRKQRGEESRYLWWMQSNGSLREMCAGWGRL